MQFVSWCQTCQQTQQLKKNMLNLGKRHTMATCVAPACYKTRIKNRKHKSPLPPRCIAPNPWVLYRSEMSGLGLTRKAISAGYKQIKAAWLRENPGLTGTQQRLRRNAEMCAKIADWSRRDRVPSAPVADLAASWSNQRVAILARKLAQKKKKDAKKERSLKRKRDVNKAASPASLKKKKEKEREAKERNLMRKQDVNKATSPASLKKKKEKEREARERSRMGKQDINHASKSTKPNSKTQQLEQLRQKYCKDFSSSGVRGLGGLSEKRLTLHDAIDKNGKSVSGFSIDKFKAYSIQVAGNGTCMWASVAGGLFGSSGQWKRVKNGSETLCDKMVSLYQEYSNKEPAPSFGYKFVKWIFLRQLVKHPDLRVRLEFFNIDERQLEKINGPTLPPRRKTRGGKGKGKATEEKKNKVTQLVPDTPGQSDKQKYAKILKLYQDAVNSDDFWGGQEELEIINDALYPFVNIVTFETRQGKSRIITRARVKPVKYETVMFVLRTRGNHYSPLNVRKLKKDFLQAKGRGMPDFVYDLPEG